MSLLSISREIASLPAGEDKRYVTAYKDVGFELGFGRGGVYRGHSHLRLIDLIFSPDGVRCIGGNSTDAKTLVIAPARTFLPDIEIGNFMFLKFCPDDGEVTLPEKVYEELWEGQILSYADRAQLTFSWYPDSCAECQNIEVSLWGSDLTIEIGCSRSLYVRR